MLGMAVGVKVGRWKTGEEVAEEEEAFKREWIRTDNNEGVDGWC